jgi:hypothetical protein
MGNTLKIPSPTKLARLGYFPPARQAGRLAGPVFYVFVFSLVLPIFSLISTAGFNLAASLILIFQRKIYSVELSCLSVLT